MMIIATLFYLVKYNYFDIFQNEKLSEENKQIKNALQGTHTQLANSSLKLMVCNGSELQLFKC